jgi:hypothetical protein
MVESEVGAPRAVCCPECGQDDGLVPYSGELARQLSEKHGHKWLGIFGGKREQPEEPLMPRYYCEHCHTIVDPGTGQTIARI